jgi:ribonuclease P/MRP protein subunit POP7
LHRQLTDLTYADAKISKRPLLHAPIASARAGSSVQKVIYVSSSSPFISIVKRVRKFLVEIDKRAMGSVSFTNPEATALGDRARLAQAGESSGNGIKGRQEEVMVKGTGKAIDKALQIALHFQGQGDCVVRLRTGSVGAIDDITLEGDGAAEDGEVEETRIRRVSVLEVAISLR